MKNRPSAARDGEKKKAEETERERERERESEEIKKWENIGSDKQIETKSKATEKERKKCKKEQQRET